LLNQVRFLRKSGSVSVQVTILTPSVGSKGYEEPFEKGMVIDEAHGHKVEDHHYDGNHCIATEDPNPWRKQLNMYLAYAAFYNPLNLVRAIVKWKDPLWSYRVLYQAYGMIGVVRSIAQRLELVHEPDAWPIRKKAGGPAAGPGNDQPPGHSVDNRWSSPPSCDRNMFSRERDLLGAERGAAKRPG